MRHGTARYGTAPCVAAFAPDGCRAATRGAVRCRAAPNPVWKKLNGGMEWTADVRANLCVVLMSVNRVDMNTWIDGGRARHCLSRRRVSSLSSAVIEYGPCTARTCRRQIAALMTAHGTWVNVTTSTTTCGFGAVLRSTRAWLIDDLLLKLRRQKCGRCLTIDAMPRHDLHFHYNIAFADVSEQLVAAAACLPKYWTVGLHNFIRVLVIFFVEITLPKCLWAVCSLLKIYSLLLVCNFQ